MIFAKYPLFHEIFAIFAKYLQSLGALGDPWGGPGGPWGALVGPGAPEGPMLLLEALGLRYHFMEASFGWLGVSSLAINGYEGAMNGY